MQLHKCRITVIKTTFDEELAKEHGRPGLGRCPRHEVGDAWETVYDKPEDFCTEAWMAIQHYVFALAHGMDTVFGDWIETPGVTINSCNDGLRPVIFKIERGEPVPTPTTPAPAKGES